MAPASKVGIRTSSVTQPSTSAERTIMTAYSRDPAMPTAKGRGAEARAMPVTRRPRRSRPSLDGSRGMGWRLAVIATRVTSDHQVSRHRMSRYQETCRRGGHRPPRSGRSLQLTDQATPLAGLAGVAERLEEALAHVLPGHLDQAELRHLRHPRLGAVTKQFPLEPPHHLLLVRLQQHVDEVDHDDAAHVAQPELTHDLIRHFEVGPQDDLLEVGVLVPGEAAGVHIDDLHRLGRLDDQVAAGGQPDLVPHGLA